jgi:hypothetical protein
MIMTQLFGVKHKEDVKGLVNPVYIDDYETLTPTIMIYSNNYTDYPSK